MKPHEREGAVPPGADGGAETKVCPFCAETIRAAAVKCRYCQSDLTGQPEASPRGPGASPPAPAADAPTQDPAVGIGSTTLPDSAPRGQRWTSLRRGSRPRGTDKSSWASGFGRMLWPAGALVLLATLALLLLALRDWQEQREIDQAARAGDVARAAVADKVEALLSYGHESFDEDVESAQQLLTPSFREEYAPTVAEIRKRAIRQRRDQLAEVLAVGLISAEEDRVRTLVFVNTLSAQEEPSESPTVMQNRVLVDLVRAPDSEEWLIDDFSFPTS